MQKQILQRNQTIQILRKGACQEKILQPQFGNFRQIPGLGWELTGEEVTSEGNVFNAVDHKEVFGDGSCERVLEDV